MACYSLIKFFFNLTDTENSEELINNLQDYFLQSSNQYFFQDRVDKIENLYQRRRSHFSHRSLESKFYNHIFSHNTDYDYDDIEGILL